MVFTNYGKQAIAWRLGSPLPNLFISQIAIGSGSGVAQVTDTTLFAETGSRMMLTGSPDFSSPRKVSFQFDYGALQLSGLTMTEFGLFQSGASYTGSLWLHETFGSIYFDGTSELQIVTSIEVI